MTTYSIKRERVTWIRPGDLGRTIITHPIFANVYADGQVVHSASTVALARQWVRDHG